MTMERIGANRCFGGEQLRFRHRAATLACDMTFSVYLPPAGRGERVPVLYWLSGLTCTDENFVTKAGAQQFAALYGVAVVAPDTSPRGEDVPDDPDGAWDFGLGAGFYVDATEEPWSGHYRMYSYVTRELPELVSNEFPVDADRAAISGHSMGGHGALTIALKNSDRYRSVSAFAPICSPRNCPWGQKALGHYLGEADDSWSAYDACDLLRTSDARLPMLVDQGGADTFLAEQLKPELLLAAAREVDYPLTYRQHDGYDHSYFFMASFMEDHVRFHAEHLS